MANDLNFEYGENTDVKYGCGTVFNGEMWVFGGYGVHKKQVNDFFIWNTLIRT